MFSRDDAELFSVDLFAPGGTAQLADTAVEIRGLALFGGFAALFAHFGEMFRAIFRHVGCATFAGDVAVIFSAALFLEPCAALLPDDTIVVFAILIADHASPFAARLRC